jgi:hypothetical protein
MLYFLSLIKRKSLLTNNDRFHSKKFYHEWDNKLPNLEGGIHVLDQSLKFTLITSISSSSSPLDNVENVGDEILNDNRESKHVLELSLEEPALEAEETSQQSVHRSIRIRTFPRKYDEFVTDVTSNSGSSF